MTKPINEMTLEELAAYAVTLEWWDWWLCAGMLVPGEGRVPDEDIDRLWEMTAYEVEEFRAAMMREFRPDLNDPATLGCVEAMCCKRHGELFYVDKNELGGCLPMVSSRCVSKLVVGDGRFYGYKTKAHALIAALAKEVQP